MLLWSLLAALTEGAGRIPPFQLTAMSLTIGGVLGLVYMQVSHGRITFPKAPGVVWLLGIAGIFGYHFLYFTALQNAPAVEAGLIAYLWPLLIVLFSTLLPGERLKAHHCIGGVLGLLGAGLIVSKGGQVSFQAAYGFGYMMAGLCALTWSGYSVLSRLYSEVPTEIITGFCLIGAVLSFVCHLGLETTVWPETVAQWACVIGLGAGPVGPAFYVWDFGVKRGDIQTLGASSYVAPLLSTLVLVLVGFAEPTWVIAAAGVLITGGAVFASKDMLFSRGGKENAG